MVHDVDSHYKAEKDFTTLIAWEKARAVKLFFYNIVLPKLPNEEKFNLNLQIRKAAVSATANISEGYGRFNYQEGIQFYRISRGSLYELKDHLITCFDLKFISRDIFDQGLNEIECAKRILNGYINFVKKQKSNS
jgi:four helix bundle protein